MIALTKLFKKAQPVTPEASQIISEELQFLLEKDDLRFAKQLRARLLDEGCNLPLIIAQPRFYALMIAGLSTHASPILQRSLAAQFHLDITDFQAKNISGLRHEDFWRAMLFFKAHLHSPGKSMAIAVTTSIDALKAAWQLADAFFQQEENFTTQIRTAIEQLHPGVQDSACLIPFPRARHRLYIALTTSLLSHIPARQAFETEFGSIPEVIVAMQADHRVFCRVMTFCRERTPYLLQIGSQTFWRVLETLRIEEMGRWGDGEIGRWGEQ